jgi:EAL domain-containing protein (putative c-di-GMP-specific phosphodiesterase class I)
VAEALVGLGATADEPPAPDGLHARRETPRNDATPVPAHVPSFPDAEDAAREPARDEADAEAVKYTAIEREPEPAVDVDVDVEVVSVTVEPAPADALASHAEPDVTSDTATFEVRFEDGSVAPEAPAALEAATEPAAALAVAQQTLAASPTTAVTRGTSRDDSQAALVHRLLEQGRLRIHYQPQVSTANGTIVGVEALVRWEDDETALRAAGELFGDGTSADSFSGATEFVLRSACADRRQWMRQIGRTLPIGVNVGLAELREPGFVPRVLRILEEADLPPAYLELEVPERALAVPDSPETEALEHAYRSGIGIAIGGFVAADAPLRALTRVPVAKLKLHRSLVADLPDDVHARMVVDAVLAIGRTLNVLVCAEGVERPAQAAYLERRQCPVVQGWHCARPMDADQFFALLKGSGVDTVQMPLMDVEELEAHARAAGVV